MFEQFVHNLKKALVTELPGKDFQYLMAPSGRLPESSISEIQEAGVLLCMYPDGNHINTIFIKRPAYQGHHGGQVSLPGGKRDETDDSLVHTALREAEEEVSLHSVVVIGSLTPLFIPVSGFYVLPVVGYVNKIPTLIPEPGEVEYIIVASLKEIFVDTNRKCKAMTIQNENRNIPYYDVKNEHIWGATAMILSELEEILKRQKLI